MKFVVQYWFPEDVPLAVGLKAPKLLQINAVKTTVIVSFPIDGATAPAEEFWMPFCLFHKLTMGFAVVGVINGVLMQETFKAKSRDGSRIL